MIVCVSKLLFSSSSSKSLVKAYYALYLSKAVCHLCKLGI